MDTSLKGMALDVKTLENIFNEIFSIDIKDNVHFKIIGIKEIRIAHPYNCYRLNILSTFETNKTYITIEVSSGDEITPKEIKYNYKCFFQDKTIPILAYNIETILAEKMHAIISNGTLTTRLKDYYDVYVLTQNKKITYNKKILIKAIKNTFKSRNESVDILKFQKITQEIKDDKNLEKLWKDYQNKNTYAKDISFIQTIDAIKEIIDILENEMTPI